MGSKKNGVNPYMDMVRKRMKHDHNPLFVQTADKIAARKYVARRIGSDYLTEALDVGYQVPQQVVLEGDCVVKPNNTTKKILIFIGRDTKSKFQIAQKLSIYHIQRWLSEPLVMKNYQWAYHQIRPGYIVERFYRSGENPASNYHVFVFGGRVEIVQRYVYGMPHRFDAKPPVLYAEHWNPDGTPIKVKWGKRKPATNPTPSSFDEVSRLSSILGEGIDHVRVDFLDTDKGLRFSEMTYYPGAGRLEIKPKEIAKRLAEAWRKEAA